MIINRTEKQYADLFKQAAEDHLSLDWFDYGNLEQIFTNNADLIFPALYLQLIDTTIGDGVVTRQYRMYVLDTPVQDTEQNHQLFEYDDNLPNSRDTTLQILRDIVTTVQNLDRQSFKLEVTGAAATSDREKEGEVGWATNFTITNDYII